MARTRQIKTPAYKSFRLSKPVKPATHQALPSAVRLFRGSLKHLRSHRRVFLGIVLVYLLLTIVFVKGFGINTGVAELKSILEEVFTGATGQIKTGFTLFALLLTNTSSGGTELTSLYQTILLTIVSLALIWALRQTHAAKKLTIRDAFYKGMYPLVPFLLVLAVIGLQLMPLLIGGWLYGNVIANGVAATAGEQAVWWVLIGLLTLLSLYMMTSSLFALYISTLPNMTPMKALRSAREVVRHRRWTILRKVLALPFMLLITGGLIMVPLIIFLTPLAEWAFFALSMAVLAVVHAYLYALYRELL